jgi:branched-chain amino acid transport system permease protein
MGAQGHACLVVPLRRAVLLLQEVTTFLALTLTGLVVGCIYALTACGLVVTYTTSGVFNFAHGAIGMVAAFSYWQLSVEWEIPKLLSLALVLLVLAPAFGAVIERVLVRPLYGAPIGVTLVVTLGLLISLIGVANLLWDPQTTRVLPKFFPGRTITIATLVVSYNELLVIAAAVAVALALRTFFARTRLGVAMRAVVDDPDLAALAGTNPQRVAQLSWALGSALAALAGVLLAPLVTLNVVDLTLLVINGYAAAMVGRLRNLPATVVGALALGVGDALMIGYAPGTVINYVKPALPMLLLFGAVLFFKQERLRSGSVAGLRMPRTASLRQSVGTGVLFVLVAYLVSGQLSEANLAIGGQGLVLAFIMLSLVLLSGYGGQVSLCQLTFVGLGAFAMGRIGGTVGLATAVALPAAAGALIALSVVRLRGLYLALATLAFAQAMDKVFFLHALGSGGSLEVERPGLPFVDVGSDRSYFVVLAVVFVLGAIGVLALRRRAFGRRLVALNDSPAACATMGVSTTVTKVIVFTASAALAGLGGAFFGGLHGSVSNNDFLLLNSCVLLLLATIGGLYTVTGAFLAAMFYALFPVLQEHIPALTQVQFLFTGLGALSLGRNRYGMGGQIAEAGERLRGLRPALPTRREVARVAG